jgi:aerobic-type carbon monoxide dehydrogenase small subunit (CoxS/CutS family)
MPPVKLTVNGRERSVDLDPALPLLWVLRDELGLTGTKFGCGAGHCGACTVHLDGEPARSCVTPLGAAAGHRVTTIEGLVSRLTSIDDGPASPILEHPVQLAWIAEQVPQCGYCQPGQIMSAVALLAKTPHPTDAEIDEAMAGNICRCGTYLRIRRAIHRAAGVAR